MHIEVERLPKVGKSNGFHVKVVNEYYYYTDKDFSEEALIEKLREKHEAK